MTKKLIAMFCIISATALPALAQDGGEGGSGGGANVHLFDDLNGDGVSDSAQASAAQSDPTRPSEESEDAEQPVDDVVDGMEEVVPEGETGA